MIDLINTAAKEALSASLEKYFAKWDEYVARMGLYAIAEKMKPVAVGWKVADRMDYRRTLGILENYAAQMHSITVQKRKFGTVVLEEPLLRGVSIIKLIERRPGSRDALGLDHIDFYLPLIEGIAEMLERSEANWRRQGSDNYKRLSVRFGPESLYEAKIIDHTILDICADELENAGKKLLHRGPARKPVDFPHGE